MPKRRMCVSKNFYFVLLLPVLLLSSCAAQEKRRPSAAVETNAFKADIFAGAGGEKVPYRLFVPTGYDPNKKYPLVLWLHGGGGRGDDNERQITEGNTLGATIWTRPENQAKNPVFVLAPQCPLGQWWADNDSELRPSKQLQAVVELLKELQKQYSIDAGRLYVAGQSMGGYGAWSVITEYPDMFAAAVPICGGGNVSKAERLVRTPIWAFHGDQDQAVNVERSREMISAIKAAGGSPKYTEYKGAGHTVWHQTFAEPELLPWVFAQKRQSR